MALRSKKAIRLWGSILLGLVTTVGCSEPAASPVPVASTGEDFDSSAAPRTEQDGVRTAMDMLTNSRLGEVEHAVKTAAYNLNTWMDRSAPQNAKWTVDPLVKRLPKELQGVVRYTNLGGSEFSVDDAKFLAETYWLRNLGRWASQQEASAEFTAWLEKAKSKLGGDAAKLAAAERLFDWTVRNVQLDRLPRDPGEVPQKGSKAKKKSRPRLKGFPPREGVPGPGYRFFPFEIMLYGHGDHWQRAWLFMCLARQQQIDVVMLALPGKKGKPQPWLPAVLLGDQLYLFDTQLGLPIPGPQGAGVATLKQVLQDPQILKNLNLDERQPYQVQARDLDEVYALVEASPWCLTKRMTILDGVLAGEFRAVVTASPQALAKRLEKCKGITSTQIWRVPYEAVLYRVGRQKRIEKDPATRADVFAHEMIFEVSQSLNFARRQQLRGIRFKTAEGEKGAANFYMDARPPLHILQKIATDKEVRERMFRIVPTRGERESTYNTRIKAAQLSLQRAKEHATFWLGLTNYDEGRYDVALDWLKMAAAEGAGPWRPGATYNLARAYEKTGRVREARDIYFKDESPQRHGNVLRARALKKQLDDSNS